MMLCCMVTALCAQKACLLAIGVCSFQLEGCGIACVLAQQVALRVQAVTEREGVGVRGGGSPVLHMPGLALVGLHHAHMCLRAPIHFVDHCIVTLMLLDSSWHLRIIIRSVLLRLVE